MFSPSSGSLNSITYLVLPLANRWVRLVGVDTQVLHGLPDDFKLDLLVAGQRVQCREDNVFGVDFEEVAQRGAAFAASEAVGAESDQRARHPLRNGLGQHLHIIRR